LHSAAERQTLQPDCFGRKPQSEPVFKINSMQKACTLVLIGAVLFCSCGHDANLEPGGQEPMNSDSQSLLPIPDTTAPFGGFLKSFHGFLENGKEIEMVLVNWGDGFLSGQYLYTQTGIPIELSGEMLDTSTFELIESHDFKDTGSFRGKFTGLSSIAGQWSNPDKTVRYSFDLTEAPSLADVEHWAGNWHLNEIWDNGTLMIGNVTRDSFDFALNVLRSGHIGTIQGRAAVHGTQASFLQREYEDEACSIRFEHHGDFIEIIQNSSNFACGFGARAYVGGKYENKWVLKKARPGIGKDGIFPETAMHEAFVKMVGESNYETFAFNLQMTEASQTADENSTKITVISGYVAGLPGTNEALIAYDTGGRIWAATLDPGETGTKTVVKYFTNDKTQAHHLPEFVESWREGFKDYPVIYASQ
jgi:hypothetical protein